MFRPSKDQILEKLRSHNAVLDEIVETIAQTPALSEAAAKKYGYGEIDKQAASLGRWRDGAAMVLMEYYDVILRGEAMAEGDVQLPDRNEFINREMLMLQIASRDEVLKKNPNMQQDSLDAKLRQVDQRLLELSKHAERQFQGFVDRHYDRPQEGNAHER